MARLLRSTNQIGQEATPPTQEPQEKDFIDKAASVGRFITSLTGGRKIGEFLGTTIASTPLLGKFVTGIELTAEEREIVRQTQPSTGDVLKSAAGAVLQTGSAVVGGGSLRLLAGKGLGAIAARGLGAGALSGGAFGAGEALDEGGEVRDVAKGFAFGAAFGGTVGLVLPVGIAGTRSAYRFGANALRQVHQMVKPKTRKVAVDNLAN